MVAILLLTQPLPAGNISAGCADVMRQSRPSAALGSAQVELMIGVGLAGIASMAVALFLSALVSRPDKAATLLPYVLIASTLLSQPFFESKNPLTDTASYVVSARWGVGA